MFDKKRINDTHANDKDKQLEHYRSDEHGKHLTTNQGVGISDNQNSLKAGVRGPTLMEDFIFREKMTHFDHERIPERVVHARGSAAHGYFQVYEPLAELTKAKFLQDPSVKTPVFVRFSTVVGFRGSADTVRDVRGFATKFYTEDGNYDLVGNNIPVFFIQDAMKFPDLVHAVKPEPHHEMPQASAAHDNFWDFISQMPESMHMIMWVLSDRALPRSYRMMDGFGVHTFRFINAEGKSRFVKFHWRALLGAHSLVWDETQKIAGKDPDFNRKDLWQAIEDGNYPEYELCVQIVEEEDEHKFDFDLLDPTKIIPEELVPLKPIGKMTLNRNPDNFFAETEQVAFHPGHVVPGIDFTNDPLLQGRLFSYTDTQLIRLGGPNFHEIPINRPICPFHNNQRDGFHRQTINKGRVNYEPNTLGDGYPKDDTATENYPDEKMEQSGAFKSHMERIDAVKIRARSESFADHYSQATLFWNSQSDAEKQHIVDGFHFELGKVKTREIRTRLVSMLRNVNEDLALRVAEKLGMEELPQAAEVRMRREPSIQTSAALSMDKDPRKSAATRKVAILAMDGVDGSGIEKMKSALKEAGAEAKIVAPNPGAIKTADGEKIEADFSPVTTASVVFDAVFVPGGAHAEKLKESGDMRHFILEAYKHCKPIAGEGEGVQLLKEIHIVKNTPSPGVVTSGNVKEFIDAIAMHRHWDREDKLAIAA